MLRFVQHHTNITCDHCGTASKRSLCISTTNPGSLRVVGNLRAGRARWTRITLEMPDAARVHDRPIFKNAAEGTAE
jgi:hypothetical protein